ncbi:hypothetical protein CEQ90_01870 [Lewinellaceae bacterium SD302]|nr:hypothetical protein CEQ90_01870 [Lewinellaceae bacterium SD302]
MKRILIICFAFLAGISAITAQAELDTRQNRRGGDPAEREAKMLERLSEALNLTDGQVADIQAFQATNKINRKAEMEAAEGREEKRAVVKKYGQLFDQQLNGVLTPEQQTKYAEIKANRKEKRGERGGRKARCGESSGS